MTRGQTIISIGMAVYLIAISGVGIDNAIIKKDVVIVTEEELVPVGRNEAGFDTFLLYLKGADGGNGKAVAVGGVGLAGIAAFVSALWRKK
jgi:hypothetical protein